MAAPFVIKPFFNRSEVASHPSVSVNVASGFKLVGGGAIIDSVEPSNFLTASFPLDVTRALPGDYVLTGGGAFVDYHGAGNMLTASFPRTGRDGSDDWYIWEARSKDHDISDPAILTVYAIGVRLRSAPENSPGLRNIVNNFGLIVPTNKPHLTTGTTGNTEGLMLTGGGAWDHWSGAGNMLTASGPAGSDAWFVRGSDHITASPATISAWAIYAEAIDAQQPSRRAARRRTEEISPLDSPYLPGST